MSIKKDASGNPVLDSNGNPVYETDSSGNEIGEWGKRLSGIVLVLITVFAIIAIIAHWPDKMPPQGPNTCTKYHYKWFHITYLGAEGRDNSDTSVFFIPRNAVIVKKDSPAVTVVVDTNAVSNKDSLGKAKKITDSIRVNIMQTQSCKKSIGCTIDLNTLILLLVALGGFLGNLIHIASSFTNFIGAGKFKRSWVLWYFVKPFTASALAVGVYIIFRAGFLNSGEATASVNLYGVVAIAILAGLFTDMATQKLKEVFAVIFQTSTARPNPLELPKVKITSCNPATLPLNQAVNVVLSGTGFDNRVLKLKIDGTEIANFTTQPNSIVFNYTATTAKPQLIIYDEKNTELVRFELSAA
ncbi:IPT/TIG domain-containing protein [Ferruginibacter sp.]